MDKEDLEYIEDGKLDAMIEPEIEVKEDITEEDDTIDDETSEVLNYMYKITHTLGVDEEDDDSPYFCFVKDISDLYDLTDDEVKKLAKENGYRLGKIPASDNHDESEIIVAKGCTEDIIKGAYMSVYDEEPKIEWYNNESLEEAYVPTKTGKAYKVFKVKDGKLYPPMVANKDNKDTPIGVWLDAEEGEFAGLSKTGRPQVKSTGSGTLSYRPGWHLGDLPRAKQFDRENKETGEMEFPKDFVWAECDYAMDVDYQPESDARGYERTKVDDKGNVITYKSDKYQHSLAGVPHLPTGGSYRYRTNPNPDTVPWVITGHMKVNRLLDDYEVNDILKKNGIEPIHRQGGDKTLAELGLKNISEDTVKVKDHKWTNKGKEGTHGTFKTKKEADAQRKAMFAQGYHEDVDESVEKHDTLNPKLWNEDDTLIPEVKDTINSVVEEFLNQLDEVDVILIPKDVILLGSNCSYNYTKDSDLDVHIIADDSLDCEQKHLDKLYGAYRSMFNHTMDITIHDIPVEIYVELGKSDAKSNGIYSVTNDKWIKKPTQESIPDIDKEAFDELCTEWENRYFDLIESDYSSEDIDNFIDDIYSLRKDSIATDGEYGLGNLVFKEFRNLGYLNNLKELKTSKKSDELSLENLSESVSLDRVNTLEKLRELSKTVDEPGTYSIDSTGKLTKDKIGKGYQVSFFRPEIKDEDIKRTLEVINGRLGAPYLGRFNDVEISYAVSREVANKIANIFNQEGVWDNKKNTLISNPSYKSSYVVNYDEASKELDDYLSSIDREDSSRLKDSEDKVDKEEEK